MTFRIWTDKDLRQLDEHYSDMGPAAMARAGMCSGRGRKTIENKARRSGYSFDADTVIRIRGGVEEKVSRCENPAPRKPQTQEARERPASSIWELAARSA